MNFFDLHCDTLYELVTKNKNIKNNDLHISLNKINNLEKYFECFAVWIPDTLRGEKALNFFDLCRKKFLDISQNNFNDKFVPILTVEGGAVLAGKINNIVYLKEMGVKILTLTWNGRCEIGDGCGVKNAGGLSDFGKKAVRELEKNNIIVDVSHAGKSLFYDIAEIAKKPFIATHSNSYKICPHKRNLDDEQFGIIKKIGGLVGITFCKEFLKEKSDIVNFDDIRRHIDHFLSLGGENTLAFGSDFDGAVVPKCIDSIEKINDLYEYLCIKNYKEKILKKLFFENAYNFLLKNNESRD
ncbi:MAG: dipeptidase [Acutalibacteraceae bacterium]